MLSQHYSTEFAAVQPSQQQPADPRRGSAGGSSARLHPARSQSPIAASRHGVPILALPEPQDIPNRQGLIASIPESVLDVCRRDCARPRSRYGRAMAALGARLPCAPRGRRSHGAYLVDTKQPADIDTHDEFFRIRRVDAAPGEAFLLGLFKSLLILERDLAETPTALSDERLAVLAGALQETLAAALGSQAAAPLGLARREEPAPTDHAGKRWIRGHQIFAALSQGMIFALNAMEQADLGGDTARMGEAAGLSATLLSASAVSLELTGDFPEAYYREVVRVGMESPFLPRGFSGLLSGDHRHLVGQMKRLRPTIDRLRERQPEKHARIYEALGAVYASHRHVCARFVGAEQSSLLMAPTAGRSAVEQIDRFKAMRLRSWAPAETEDRR